MLFHHPSTTYPSCPDKLSAPSQRYGTVGKKSIYMHTTTTHRPIQHNLHPSNHIYTNTHTHNTHIHSRQVSSPSPERPGERAKQQHNQQSTYTHTYTYVYVSRHNVINPLSPTDRPHDGHLISSHPIGNETPNPEPETPESMKEIAMIAHRNSLLPARTHTRAGLGLGLQPVPIIPSLSRANY